MIRNETFNTTYWNKNDWVNFGCPMSVFTKYLQTSLLYFTGYTDLQKCQWPLHYRMAENCGHYTQDHNTIMLWRRVVNLIEVAKWNPLPQNSIYNTVIVFIFFVLLQDRGHQTLSNDTLVKLRTLDRNPSSASNYASQYGGGSPQVSSKFCTFLYCLK